MVLKNEKNIKIRFIPREPGVFTKNQIQTIYEIVSKQENCLIELTLDLPLSVSVSPDLEKEVKEKLISAGLIISPNGNCVKEVKVCPNCDHGKGDYRNLGRTLNEDLMGTQTSGPIRMSVSGCGCMCGMSMLQDIGVVAGANGYSIYIGGSPYGKPIIAEKLIDSLKDEEVLPALNAILSVYNIQNRNKKHLSAVLKKIGLDTFKQAIEEIR